jgi:hypothetical protein
MRALLVLLAASTVVAADSGLPLRLSPSAYAVQGQSGGLKIAAEIVPSNVVGKKFSPEIAKDYIVVEVAVYPAVGSTLKLEAGDFSLRVGQLVGHAEKPMDVGAWPEGPPTKRLPVDVTAEAGIIHESDNDPVYGRRQATGTYTGVTVSTPPRDLPPPPPNPNPQYVYDRIQRLALPEGDTRGGVAGYLYFPQRSKHKKNDEIQLRYATNADGVNLLFPRQ